MTPITPMPQIHITNLYMRARIYKLLIYFLLIINFGTSHANQVEHLYNSKILVVDKSAAEQKRAFAEAVEDVLSRVALDKNMQVDADIKNQKNNADKYINKYYYTQDEDKLYLNIEFDAQAIQEVFKEEDASNQQAISTTTITLSISGINDLQKLADIEAYLTQLPYVKQIQIGELQGTSVAFNLNLAASDKENLIKAISLYSALQPEDMPIENSADQLYYRYE